MSVETAIVTGAASGIGALAVRRMRNQGIHVLAADRNPAIVTQYAADDGIKAVAADVTVADECAELVEIAERTFGHVDRLFHSAGIMPGGAIADMPTEQILQVMNVNYGGTVNMTKAVLPGMRKLAAAEIIVLGSLTGYVPSQRLGAYSASKAAVNTYIETLAREERQGGVHVLLVAPNAVKTPLLSQTTGGPKMIEKMSRQSSSRLMISPEDVLDAIERALKKKESVIKPGGKPMHALRRLSPALTWFLADMADR